jgi:hypothetical protein
VECGPVEVPVTVVDDVGGLKGGRGEFGEKIVGQVVVVEVRSIHSRCAFITSDVGAE